MHQLAIISAQLLNSTVKDLAFTVCGNFGHLDLHH